jgi:hypothetical protein
MVWRNVYGNIERIEGIEEIINRWEASGIGGEST